MHGVDALGGDVQCKLVPAICVSLLFGALTICVCKDEKKEVGKHLFTRFMPLVKPQISLLRAKRKIEQVKFVASPKEMLISFSCVRFLTDYDVRKRKQHIDRVQCFSYSY